jgi:hypothetical protein
MGTRAERQSRKEALLVSLAAGIMGRLGERRERRR